MIYNKTYECMSKAEKKNLQSERLVSLVKRVYENVIPYREKMDAIKLKPSDIKSIDDIYKLPYTTKQDLRNNYPFGMFAVPQKDIVRLHASSATTGKLTVVGYTQNDLNMWSEVMARSLTMANADSNSTVHVCYGYGLFTGGLGAHYGAEMIGASVVPASTGNTARQLMLLKDFQATHICCTPSYAIYLAEEIKKCGMNLADFNLKAGVFGAEAWSEEMRATIEKELNIKAYDIYGLSEICGPGVSCECEMQSGMHIQDDHFYPEIIDKDSLEPLSCGEEGELVFTTLTKEGIPLIRYRTRDIASLSDTPCACGRTTIKMNKVFGRTDDMLIIRGVNVFPSQIESVLLNSTDVSPYYHINVDRINNLDIMEIQVEVNDKVFSDEIKNLEKLNKKLTADIQSAIGISAKITLVSPNTLTRTEGKANRITDLRKLK